MVDDSIEFQDNIILVEKVKELHPSYKVRSYNEKLKLMKEEDIEQKPILDVLQDFLDLDLISNKTKKSISKVYYSPEDRIIVIITSKGKEIIWKREELVKKYGWFFFVTRSFTNKQREKRKKGKEETLISEKEVNFGDFKVTLKEKENMRHLYHTKEYGRYLGIMKSQHVKKMDISQVLEDFFIKDRKIPKKEKNAIRTIIYYEKERVIVVKSLIGDEMYENLEYLVKKYGWYFYITGVPVGSSEISEAVDKINRRFEQDYFNHLNVTEGLIDKKNIPITLYPIALRPNYNSLILGIGNLNILLDCGITEDDLDSFNEYLKKLPELREKEQKNKIILTNSDRSSVDTDGIEDLKDFGTDTGDINEDNYNLDQKLEEKDSDGGLKINESKVIDSNIEDSYTPKIDAIFVSHSHFDHVSGLKDLIKKYPDVPVLCSRITLDLYLLRDSDFLKQESHEEIEDPEYRKVIKNVIFIENGEKLEFAENDCYLAFFHAGHMPGALMMQAKVKDFRFLFTGDYTYWDVTPFAGTRRFLDQISRPIDFLLIDGTSAYEEFGNPSQQFESLVLFLEQKAEYEDNSLIGADPSSLAISFMLKFWRHFRKKQLRSGYEKRPNIYVDLMVRKNIQVINHRYKYIHGPISRLIRDKANPFNSIKFRWFTHDDLDFLKKRNNIIISHPPDLSYGIIRNIINVVGRNPHNLVYLAGAIHEEPGLDLINGEKEIELGENWNVPFRALLINTFAPNIKIKLHGDKNQLTEMIKTLKPKEVCFFHQATFKLMEVAEYVQTLDVDVEKVSVLRERKLVILN
jgi:Cft2 family RNA processing exonuclease